MRLSFPSGGPVILNAKVDHAGTTRLISLLFDTGASRTIISKKRLESAGVTQNPTGRIFDITTANGRELMTEHKCERLSIQEVKREDFLLLAHDFPKDVLVDGLLGWDFFGESKISFDGKLGIFDWTEPEA